MSSQFLLQPLRTSLLCSLLYVVLSTVYIILSDKIAKELASTAVEQQQIEDIKGVAFVLITGIMIFGLFYILLRKISAQSVRIYEQQSALIATESRTAAGDFAASIAHDMNNVLSGLMGHFWLIEPKLSSLADSVAVNHLNEGINSLVELTRQLSTMGRVETGGALTVTNLSDIVNKAIAFTRGHPDVRACDLTTSASRPILIETNEPLAMRMLTNLIINAGQATNGKGHIEIRIVCENDALIEIHDNGPGISPEVRKRIFEPFYTTKVSGTGLGLLSAKVFAELHNGAVEITQSDLGGACIGIRIPQQCVM